MQIKQNNSTLVCGALAKAPELKVIKKGEATKQLVELSLAIGKDDENKTIWANVDCWGLHAQIAKSYKTGDIILCAGIIVNQVYVGRDGVERTSSRVRADFILKLDKPTEQVIQTAPEQSTDLSPVEDIDDLPF